MGGFYSRIFFPRLVDWVMSGEDFAKLRRKLLSDLSGTVLEIGFGTGLNLPHYPEGVTRLLAVDVNPGMTRRARLRVEHAQTPVEMKTLDGEALPFEDASIDNAVSTWTLCSIRGVERALGEIHRVLVPGGRFLFLEHGLSPDTGIARWQHRLTPLQRIVGDGCHLDRDIEALIQAAAFQIRNIEAFYMDHVPRIGGWISMGTALKQPHAVVNEDAQSLP